MNHLNDLPSVTFWWDFVTLVGLEWDLLGLWWDLATEVGLGDFGGTWLLTLVGLGDFGGTWWDLDT